MLQLVIVKSGRDGNFPTALTKTVENVLYRKSDSAFSNSPTVVSAFKAYNCNSLEKDKEDFNTVLGRLRVSSEHTIGILKGRFPILKCIPMKLTERRKSMKRILQMIESCIILHNILLSNESESENQAWIDEEE